MEVDGCAGDNDWIGAGGDAGDVTSEEGGSGLTIGVVGYGSGGRR